MSIATTEESLFYQLNMVQASPRQPAFNPQGREHAATNSIVPVLPNLPYFVEVRTSHLIAFLQKVYDCNQKQAVQNWLAGKVRTGFHFEITEHLHFTYADQRDGRGTQHWWQVYFDDFEKRRVFETIRIQENLVSTRQASQEETERLSWNGLQFASETEKRIARALYSQKVIFFANLNGFMALDDLPVSNQDNRLRDKAEVDFLVFHNQKCMILEVDGSHHNQSFYQQWDCKRDRVFLRQGISTVRFSAEQCYQNSLAVVDEFLTLFN